MTEATMSIGGALKAAVELWRRALPRVWAPLVGMGLVVFVTTAPLGVSPLWLVLIVLLQLPISAVAYGGLMRLALGDLHPGDPEYRLGPAGLQWRGGETRLLGSLALVLLFLVLAVIAAVFAVMLVSIVTAAVTGASAPTSTENFLTTPSGMAGAGVFVLALAAILWSAVRLTLSTPATVDRNQVQVFSTWALTRRMFWPLLGALVVIGLPSIVLNIGATWLKMCDDGVTGLLTLVYALYALVLGLVQTPMAAGVIAYFYRQARGETAPHNP